MIKRYTVMSSVTDKPVRYCTCDDSDEGLLLGENEYLVEGIQARVVEDLGLLSEVRRLRGLYLQESDWTQVVDSPLSDTQKSEWATYRTSLRDLPSGKSATTSIENVTWPKKPN